MTEYIKIIQKEPYTPKEYPPLCSVDDVLIEAGIQEKDEELELLIQYKIKDVTDEIYYLTREDLDQPDNYYFARMACVYNILHWLEQRNKIPNPSQINSIHEGDITINYTTNIDKNNPQNYQQAYKYYLSYLTTKPPLPTNGKQKY
jgi:hypothetical protein